MRQHGFGTVAGSYRLCTDEVVEKIGFRVYGLG